MNGFLLIDKPAGISSNQVLNLLKRKTKLKKMGHTGTLDPFATGLLVVGVGEALKVIPYLNEEPKVYEATLKLGEATDTLDLTGTIVESKVVSPLDEAAIRKVMASFIGRRQQLPPMYSAKKSGEKRLYDLAREGIEVERRPVPIEIFDMEYVGARSPRPGGVPPPLQTIRFRVSCSRGTYVRVLGAEIAEALDTVGHLTALCRLKAGPFDLKTSVSLDADWKIEVCLMPLTQTLSHLPQADLSSSDAKRISQGQPVNLDNPGKDPIVLMSGGQFLGIGEFREGQLWPRRLIAN